MAPVEDQHATGHDHVRCSEVSRTGVQRVWWLVLDSEACLHTGLGTAGRTIGARTKYRSSVKKKQGEHLQLQQYLPVQAGLG